MSSWLSYLNTIQPDGAGAAGVGGDGGGLLTDDLRSQLEAWTTVTFEDNSAMAAAASRGQSFVGEDKPEPSPYAKRPFGHTGNAHPQQTQLQQQQQQQQQQQALERGFNAFISSSDSAAFGAGRSFPDFSDLRAGGSTTGGVEGISGAPSDHDFFGLLEHNNNNGTYNIASPSVLPHGFASIGSDSPAAGSAESSGSATGTTAGVGASGHPTQRKKRSHSSSNATSSESASASPHAQQTADGSTPGFKVSKQPLLTKAAILAAQAKELAAQTAATPEEEAARLAELNRIAAEDDKRRRNTAASARFRVKKKQREQALEENIRELNVKIEKLEKELDSKKIENDFLRDLVIRKVGLTDLPIPNTNSGSGRISGGQEGATGMGTSAFA